MPKKIDISNQNLEPPLHESAYILRWEALQGSCSGPQGFQPLLGVNFSRFKLYTHESLK